MYIFNILYVEYMKSICKMILVSGNGLAEGSFREI